MNPLIGNPFLRAIKKYTYELLPHAYTESVDETLDHIGSVIYNEKQAEKYIKLMAALYSAGYTKAIDDTRERLAKEGIKLKIVPSPTN